MHNVNIDALRQTSVPVPNGEPVTFQADFPPPMGGTGAAPNPLAYCFWGGMACYAMTYAQEAAKQGIQLRALRARAEAEVDMTRALGARDNPPVERIDWHLEVEADAPREKLDELKRLADEQCPGVSCVRQPIDLATHLDARCPMSLRRVHPMTP